MELDFLTRLASKLLGTRPGLVHGIGDDAAVWEWNNSHYGLISVDTLHEYWDFDRVYHAPRYVGYKAATAAISDICAMNGEPLFLVVSLGIPRHIIPSYMEDVYAGFRAVEEKYNVAVVGGDISGSRDLWLSVTVVGRVEKERITYRKGASPTHLLCVTGDLGGAYAGLKILQREKAVFLANPSVQPDVADFTYVVSRQLKPEARCDMVRRLRDLGIKPSSMTDLSDGLAVGLHALSKASGVGFHVYLARLPFHDQTQRVSELLDSPLSTFLLYGGEEYELLFTVPVEDYEKLKQEPQIHVIGFATELEEVLLEDPLGQVQPVPLLGWDSLTGYKNEGSSADPSVAS
ncbi:MAG: thiamine-phosphate kinase [Bacteroidia bacterium]|nr:thiamine-phosphate kinase [Bacteroidia bacterium]